MTTPAAFAAQYPFPLDDFQVTAIDAVDAGRSVLVAAPTGSGKTVVAEFAIERALDRGGKAFYTTPLKALSNQKYGDLVARHGADHVGLLTGDNAVNSEAPVVVMTTEVLRNMLYERSGTLDGLMTVIMDEVHYLQDPYRGAVWEEVLIHLALSASVVCLSATISNAEEFGEWIQTLRGETTVVIEERRPVPLEHHYLIGRRLHPMHIEQEGILLPNPYVVSLDQQELRVKEYRRVGSNAIQTQRMNRPREGHRRVYAPRREEVVEVLAQADMLPAIYFVFSRAGCDRSVRWLRESGVRLTTHAEADRIRERAESRAAWIDEEDLVTLGFYEFLDGLTAGVAAHHAGMLPVFKETVEELFEAGLVKVVFATETLSLGINMPARTVVIEDLWKFQGERHEILTPGEYTQLTGRAGRRGIDALGHAVVVYQRQVPFERVAGLAATRTYDLNSSFRPSYNMAVNLVRNYDREQAHRLLNSSFAQFLADRGVVSLERQREHDRQALEGYRANLVCHLGDFDEYWRLLSEAKRLREEDRRGRERDRVEAIRSAVAGLRPGEVVHLPRARRRGLAVVLSSRDGKPTVLSEDRSYFRLSAKDFDDPPTVLTRIVLPRSGSSRSARYRRDVAARLVSLHVKRPREPRHAGDPEVERKAAEQETLAARHPCASCPERSKHERWATRADALAAQMHGVERRIQIRTETLARQFDRVLAVLESLGYVDGWAITPKGGTLARIYGEGDLLVGESLASELFEGLSPSEAASLLSTVVYESRERVPSPGELPTGTTRERYELLERTYRRIRRVEEEHQVELSRSLDAGFATPVFHWAEGKPLEDVLEETEMAPGDFVRNCKQLVDLLHQIEDVADGETAAPVPAGARLRDARRRRVHRGLATMRTMNVSPFGSLAVIANPHAGEGRVGRELSALERGLAGRGLEYSLQVTEGPGDATRLATDAMDAGVRFLVAVGGDGTVHEVVNGMFRDGRPIVEEPVLGVVPAHSGCDLVKSFGLPGDVDAACGHLLGDNTYPFDVVKVAFTDPDGRPAVRYSVNLAEIGFGAAVAAKVGGRPGRARSFMAFWSTLRAHAGPRRADRGRSQRVRRAGVQRDRGQRAVRLGWHASVAALVPGGRGGGRAGLHRTAFGRLHPPAGHVPPRRPRPPSAHPRDAREDPGVDRRGTPAPDRRRRRTARNHAGDVPDGSPIDPVEAVTADHLTRRERLAAEVAEERLAAVVVAPSPDLVYLTGYGPMPLERLTALVIRPDGDAVLVVPELERQLALDSTAGQTLQSSQVVGWRDGDDPYALVASFLPREGRVAVGDRMWASHVLALQEALPGISLEPASRIIGRLRAVKDPDELGALRTGGTGSRRDVPSDLRPAVPRAPGGGGRGRPRGAARRARSHAGRFHDRRLRAQRRLAPSRARRTHDPAPGRRRARLRRRAGWLLLRHDPHRGRGGAARGVRRGVRAGAGRPGRGGAGGPARGGRTGRRPSGAPDHRRRRLR